MAVPDDVGVFQRQVQHQRDAGQGAGGQKVGVIAEEMQDRFRQRGAGGHADQTGDAEHADALVEALGRDQVGDEGEHAGEANRQADAVDDADDEQKGVEAAEPPFERQVAQRHDRHHQAAHGIAALAAEAVDHLRNPRPAKCRGQGEGAHDQPDVVLPPAVIGDVQRKEEKSGETGDGREIGDKEGDERRGVEHGHPFAAPGSGGAGGEKEGPALAPEAQPGVD